MSRLFDNFRMPYRRVLASRGPGLLPRPQRPARFFQSFLGESSHLPEVGSTCNRARCMRSSFSKLLLAFQPRISRCLCTTHPGQPSLFGPYDGRLVRAHYVISAGDRGGYDNAPAWNGRACFARTSGLEEASDAECRSRPNFSKPVSGKRDAAVR
jgi:hypothetical protein